MLLVVVGAFGCSLVGCFFVSQADRKRQADMKKAQLAKEAQLEEGEYEAAVRLDEFATFVLLRWQLHQTKSRRGAHSCSSKRDIDNTVSVVSGFGTFALGYRPLMLIRTCEHTIRLCRRRGRSWESAGGQCLPVH